MFALSAVSGLGFGIMSSLISYIAVLAESAGPGLLANSSCAPLSTYYVLGTIEYVDRSLADGACL